MLHDIKVNTLEINEEIEIFDREIEMIKKKQVNILELEIQYLR